MLMFVFTWNYAAFFMLMHVFSTTTQLPRIVFAGIDDGTDSDIAMIRYRNWDTNMIEVEITCEWAI